MSRIYVAVDLETTGLAAESDAILEIGAVKFRLPTQIDEEPIIARWSTLVNPGRPIPYNISRLTGITQDELDQAPSLKKVLGDFSAFVGNYPIVGHYVPFELSFLQRQGALIGQAHLDTFELASLLLPTAPRYSLGQLAAFLDITFDDWHRALPDAEMSARLMLALWHKTRALPFDTLKAIADISIDSSWGLRSFFVAAYRLVAEADKSEQLVKRNCGLRIANCGMEEIRNPKSEIRNSPLPAPANTDVGATKTAQESPQSPLVPSQELPAPQEMGTLLAKDGPIAHAIPDYEPCTEQIAILDATTRAFEEQSHLMLEVGAGSGPMRAYTIAAIYEALRRGEPVVIALRTYTMQKQLLEEELPFLRACLPHPFTVHSVKKPSHYLCPRRVEMLRQRGNFSAQEARLLARVLIWMLHTESGDRSEVNIQQQEEEVWSLLCTDEESCSPERCAPYGTCYWFKARERAKEADLLIAHHRLLTNDLVTGGKIIPPYKMLIVDEAHHLEEQATWAVGFVLSPNQLYTALERVYNKKQPFATGLLAVIGRQLSEKSPLTTLCKRLEQQVASCRQSVDHLLSSLEEALHHQRHERYRYRIRAKWHYSAEWNQLACEIDIFASKIKELLQGLAEVQSQLTALGEKDAIWLDRADESRRLISTLQKLSEEIDRILINPSSNDVCWIRVREADKKNKQEQTQELTLYRSPIHIASLLRTRLFKQTDSVILTSSTLGGDGDYSFLRERLGIEHAQELSVGTPYNYSKQALVYLADDMPPPNKPSYINSLQRAIVELARATKGRMLVLFTSITQLKSTYRAISPTLGRDNIIVLGQQMDGPNTQLIQRFRTQERAVLLGTHYFWEGVDIPGPALSCLVITRLPFPPTSEPTQAVRGEAYRDSFLEYRIPQMIIRFRQGFERLIRSQNDRGVIAILDSRLKHKRYGQSVLDSLPHNNLRIGRFHHLPPLAERWLNENSQ
ncbi:MAG: helicase C-terminal domain-containing protein [Ardenticatenaceae bacterium]